MTFNDLSLHPKILEAITEAGYCEPTEIQSKAIPKVLRGFDIRASAQTGTGKTAAFLLPALCRLVAPAKESGHGPRVLILAPTRELAMQIGEQANKYSKYLPRAKTVCIGGGVPYHMQTRKLSRPYDILVATPGRLIDFMNRGKISFSRLEMLVLDEADRMLDMGFIEPVEQIVAATPKNRQTLLFSATLRGAVLKLSERLLNKPMDIIVHAERAKHDNIEQTLHYVDDLNHKNRLLDHILAKESVNHALVFTSTKRHADQLVSELHEKGHRAAALHGDMNQRQRTRTIGQFKENKLRILVATDVAARGIDVQSITHVINFDLPRNIEDYVHRIGRTGRAGAKGAALSFAGGRDTSLVKRIEKFTGQEIDIVEVAGMEPRRNKRPSTPSKHRRPQRSSGSYSSKGRSSKPSKSSGSYSSKGPRSSDSSRSSGPYSSKGRSAKPSKSSRSYSSKGPRSSDSSRSSGPYSSKGRSTKPSKSSSPYSPKGPRSSKPARPSGKSNFKPGAKRTFKSKAPQRAGQRMQKARV